MNPLIKIYKIIKILSQEKKIMINKSITKKNLIVIVFNYNNNLNLQSLRMYILNKFVKMINLKLNKNKIIQIFRNRGLIYPNHSKMINNNNKILFINKIMSSKIKYLKMFNL